MYDFNTFTVKTIIGICKAARRKAERISRFASRDEVYLYLDLRQRARDVQEAVLEAEHEEANKRRAAAGRRLVPWDMRRALNPLPRLF